MRGQASLRKQGNPRFKFVGETISELRKVVWPTRQETTYLTSIVVVVSVVVAIILWLIDSGFLKLMDTILIR